MDGRGGCLCFPRGLGSLDRMSKQLNRATEPHRDHVAELAALRETDRRRQAQMVETLQVIRDMRREMSDMQAVVITARAA
ncbi:hypothetical protein Tco_0247210 [Tanacetum coccineum]